MLTEGDYSHFIALLESPLAALALRAAVIDELIHDRRGYEGATDDLGWMHLLLVLLGIQAIDEVCSSLSDVSEAHVLESEDIGYLVIVCIYIHTYTNT